MKLGSNCSLFSPSVAVGTLQFNAKKVAVNYVNIQIAEGKLVSVFFVDCGLMANLPPISDVLKALLIEL